ncbi:hypothetical protein W97_02420 [Coniosporium apollinis CBS 100218]|uniref:Pre-mRNA-splicing factor CWC22 n=1 Tax=Coniosporium apollinis (strain CBS 100218) TaxID=1168221 RepID=R7YMV8_CONA1|nr:uncharacterized protein W97_02420 [Coniosporium apollinis CBS 100218]EON63193.1 hypothetical protein W97_02420 [Coniosporium apollinis CBS 100218]
MAEVLSAVRLPTPEPHDAKPSIFDRNDREGYDARESRDGRAADVRDDQYGRDSPEDRTPREPRGYRAKRKRSPSSRSPSPRPPPGPLPRDVDRERAVERLRQLEMRSRQQEEEPSKPLTAEEKQAAAKAEYEKLLSLRSGGTYIPPARLRALQAQITDKSSKEYQRMAWEALKKSINGLVNKVNISNIKSIVPELFQENLIRGRGLFCRSIMRAQQASLPFTPIFAAMVAIVNTKLPSVGELLVNRLIVQFRRAFKRNDKAVCIASTTFLAQLCNVQVCHEVLAAQILLLLLNKPTDDSVEVSVNLMREVGQHLEEFNAPIAMAVYDRFRSILHEADIEKRTQYQIEVLFAIRKDKYKDNPAVKEELDLVEEEDQITHRPNLDDDGIEVMDGLNVFKYDPEWEAHEEAYKKLKAEILGEAEGSDEEYESDGDESSEDEEAKQEKQMEIQDQSNTDLVNLRRTIYLTIKSSGGFEEAVHKLMRVNIPAGKEDELPSMILECASQERTYDRFYGLMAERFCKLNRLWNDLFEAAFVKYYDTIHRYETNRLRILACVFAHLLASDAIGWHVLSVVTLTEDSTTSSSRIFIKILFEELVQAMGMKKLTERMRDPTLQPSFVGIFPKDTSRNTRFAINYFTAIGMGALTEDMREHLKNMPKPAPPALPPPPQSESASDSGSESVSSYSSYSSRSRSRSPSPRRSRGRGRSPSHESSRSRSRSYSSSRSPSRTRDRRRGDVRDSGQGRRRTRSASSSERSRSRSVSRSRTPPPRRSARARSRSYTPSVSRSPPSRRNGRTSARARSYTPSISRSPPSRRGAQRSPAECLTVAVPVPVAKSLSSAGRSSDAQLFVFAVEIEVASGTKNESRAQEAAQSASATEGRAGAACASGSRGAGSGRRASEPGASC